MRRQLAKSGFQVGLAGLLSLLIAGQAPMQPVNPAPKPQPPAQESSPESSATDQNRANVGATNEVSGNGSRRTPKQVEILRDLIRRREQPTQIITPSRQSQPASPQYVELSGSGLAQNARLLREGSMVVERPGRFVIENKTPMFVFTPQGEQEPRTLEINKNEFLEALEQAAANGSREFVISAEVTRYRGRNLLTLKKVLQRVSNGNLSP
ncbi:MAG: hypothetical protein AB7N71_10475 [Phycisphaerae bacterium]